VIPAAIVGVGGYTGRELLRLLLASPAFEPVALFGSARVEPGATIRALAPEFRGLCDLAIEPASADAIAACGASALFFATPHEASATLIPQVLGAAPHVKAIDLSGAFRFKDASVYPAQYGFAHPATELLAEAVYGMPERSRRGLDATSLVACAGCYVTAASIPLSVLVNARAIAPKTRPIIDAISGVSGAGRGPRQATSFCEVSLAPYGVLNHRHRPEIEQAAGSSVIFQPHLGPFDRGISATIHATLAGGWNAARIAETFEAAFADEPFVRLLGDAAASAPLPSVAGVRGTNFIDIAWAVEHDHLIVFSAIDNLMKGASGQALQCANIAFGIDETAGLLPSGLKTGALA